MPYFRPPRGITPPSPGLEREEPSFVPEEDIPSETRPSGRAEHGDERPPRSSELE